MHPDIHLVIKLQDLDRRTAELDKEIAALPKHVAQIERALDIHNRRLEADRAAIVANQKDRKKLEGDIQVHEQKISKLRDQNQQAKTNEQYRAFQNEIGHFQAEIRKAEDRILDLMSESEPLEANVKKAEAALKQEKAQVEAEKSRAVERTAADEKELALARAERAELAAKIAAPVLKMYEHARKKWHSGGIAEAVDGRCSACQISLRPQFFQELRAGDRVLTCETCGRILFYDPPVNVESKMA
jgi:uncharacterized protein